MKIPVPVDSRAFQICFTLLMILTFSSIVLGIASIFLGHPWGRWWLEIDMYFMLFGLVGLTVVSYMLRKDIDRLEKEATER